MIKSPLSILLLVLLTGTGASAELAGGLLLDTSSNMLQRPDGESGTFAMLYASYDRQVTRRVFVMYGVQGDFLEYYAGVQHHSHEFTALYDAVTGNNLNVNATVSAELSRYGDVTRLAGYNTFSADVYAKYYITPALLMRASTIVGLKRFLDYESENCANIDGFLRFDRFFRTRTTVRLQLEGGVRRYDELENTPSATLVGGRLRLAQSMTNRCGMWIEAHGNDLSPPSAGASDMTLYDRIFLDDIYKYSNRGVILSLKYLFPGKGSLQFKGSFARHDYPGDEMAAFNFLPGGGWREDEQKYSISMTYHPGVIPESLRPTYELYFIDVDASEQSLSYDGVGMTLSLAYR